MQFAYVALGGAIGAVFRFGIQTLGHRVSSSFPLGTVLANLVGCLAAGFLFYKFKDLSDNSRALLFAGFLGALTTMSAFSLETLQLIQDQRYGPAALNWVTGSILAIGACFVGFWLAKS